MHSTMRDPSYLVILKSMTFAQIYILIMCIADKLSFNPDVDVALGNQEH